MASRSVGPAAAEDDPVETIKWLLKIRVMPLVLADGGSIEFHSFDPESGVVRVKLRGACLGCPSASVTLKLLVEKQLKEFLPEVVRVEAVDDDGVRVETNL